MASWVIFKIVVLHRCCGFSPCSWGFGYIAESFDSADKILEFDDTDRVENEDGKKSGKEVMSSGSLDMGIHDELDHESSSSRSEALRAMQKMVTVKQMVHESLLHP